MRSCPQNGLRRRSSPGREDYAGPQSSGWVHHEQDARGRDLDLCYFGDVDGREVDLVVVERRTPMLFVECKLADAAVDRSLHYLKARFPKCEAWQVSATGRKDYVTPDAIRVAPALRLLEKLV